MFRAHELISVLGEDYEDYSNCVAAVKFDLGDMDNVIDMFDISSNTFFNIPAPICLFQVTQEMDLHFFLAINDCGGTIWRRYGKQLNDGFKWVQEDIEFFIEPDGKTIITKRISTGEVLTNGSPKEDDGLTDSQRWTILKFIQIAGAVEVFSCSNVIQVEHKAPKLINEKRKKKGKIPLFSYRTLHITGHANNKEAKGKGAHESPRLHFRRGHIRKLSDERRVWVSSCLVGDKSKGFSSHDYKVRIKRSHKV